MRAKAGSRIRRTGHTSRGRRMLMALMAACTLGLALGASSASAEELTDFSGPAFQILAPGEQGTAFPGTYFSDR